jgi:thiamine pyrophosphokinase
VKSTRHRALVVLNGDPPSKDLLSHLVSDADLVVAADGGANVLKRHGLKPDVIVGDLDSIRPATKRAFSGSRVIELADQDSTDFEKAFSFLLHEKIPNAMVAGMGGKRIDFTLGNFVSVWRYVPHISISIFGDDWFAVPVTGELALSLPLETTVSLIPFSRCTGVSLNGFRYPLRRATMNYGSLGVSNMTTREECSVSVSSGKLLVVVLTK